ncbi:MAG: thioredoxin family protein [Lewinellaceae bacterium]|nr:thioredoxin family protein [Lewinellaceae bacterium]
MSRILYLLIVIVLYNLNVQAQGIEFLEVPWKDAFAKAKEEQKLVFIDCYTKWCGPCKAMAKNTFTQKEVGDFFNENFINLKLDMEGEDGVTFSHKYAVSAYPTLYFIDGEGKIVKKFVGGRQPDALISIAKDAIKSNDQSAKFEENYNAGDRSYDLVLGYVKALNAAGKPSGKIANDYIRSKPDITEDQLLVFYFEALVESDSRIFNLVLDHRNQVGKLVGFQQLQQKLAASLDASVKKAIQFESEPLLDETLTNAKRSIPKDSEQFSFESKMSFYSALRQADKYREAYKGYIKSDAKNSKTYNKVISSITGTFDDNKEMMADAEKYSEKLFDLTEDYASLKLLVQTFSMNGSYSKALSIVEKAKEKIAKKGENTSQYEALEGFLKSKM